MSVSRSIAWMGAAQVTGLSLQFGAQIVLARYLSPHEVGIYAVALATVGALSLLQALGLEALIVREDDLTPELSATIFTVNAVFAVVLALLVALIGRAGAAFLGDPGVGRVLYALAVTPIINAFAFLPMAMIEREGRFRDIALANSAVGVATAVTSIGCAIAGFSYMSAAYGQWAGAVALVLASLALARRHARIRISFAAWRRVAAFGLRMTAINGISAITLRLSDIVLPRFLGLAALGLYSRAGGLNGLMWYNAHVFLGRVMLVDFVELHRRGVSLRERYLATIDAVTALLWPVFGGFAVVAGPFIFTVFGERWTPATVPLALLLVSSMVQLAISMTWELFTATGQLSRQARIEFVRALAALALFVAGCSVGIGAAAASRVVEALVAILLYRPHLNRMTDTRTADLVPIYTRNALLTCVAVGPAGVVMQAHGWRPDTPLSLLVPAAAIGAALWAGALALLRHPVTREARRLLPQAR